MRPLALLLAVVLLPLTAIAQMPGHSSVPSSGPAARERPEAPPQGDQDQVLAALQQLRKDLSDFEKRYKKTKGADREAAARKALQVLAELQARAAALKEQ